MTKQLARRYCLVLMGALLCGQILAPVLRAQETDQMELIRRLLQRVEELEQKVKMLEAAQAVPQGTNDGQPQQVRELNRKVQELERQRQRDQEAQEATLNRAPRISIGQDGFYFSSADEDFGLRLGGLLQVDTRSFFDDPAVTGNNEMLLRRARPILEGTLFRDFDFRLMPDFAPSGGPEIADAYVNYTYCSALQFQAGKFKVPVGLERLVSAQYILFNERALPSQLVPNRDLGFELHGDLFQQRVSYAAGIFNGTRDGTDTDSNFDNARAFAGRLFVEPLRASPAAALRGLGLGVGGSYDTQSTPSTRGLPSSSDGSVAGYLTDGQQQFFAYNPADGAVVLADDGHWRLSPQGYYFYGPFGLLAEYVISNQEVTRETTAPFTSARLQHAAWQVGVAWMLTGETAQLEGVAPERPFDPAHGHWGAWQLVGRYGELDIDSSTFPLFSDPAASARSAKAWSVGLNWYLNRNVLVRTSFSHTSFRGGGSGASPPGNITHQDENALFTRVQLGF